MFVKGKVALITGGVSGIGLSIAKEFLRNGLKGVLLADVNTEKGKEVAALLEDEYGPNKVLFLKVNVADCSEFENAFKQTIEKFQNIDIVINNAGVGTAQDDQLININLNGVLHGTSLAINDYLPKYKTFEDAVIINIASIFGLDGCPVATAYSASKHGVIGIGKCLSNKAHFEATGVKILTICPGFTATDMTSDMNNVSLPGRYNDILKEILPTIYFQQPKVVSSALTKILEDFNTGDVWIIEDEECYQVEIPTRKCLQKIRTLEI